MQKKIALITGANSGVGKEIALGLAEANMHVILVCRNKQKGDLAQQEIKTLSGSNEVDLFIADLSSQKDIHQLAKSLEATYSKLDILVNNAGIVLKSKTLSVDNIEMTLATNHLGPFLLTQLLLPLLQKSEAARIINVSSEIHKWASLDLQDLQFEKRKYRFMKAYAQSKLLMNIAAMELSRKLRETTMTVNCYHPGAVKTNLGSDSEHSFLWRGIDKLIKSFFISPKRAASTAIYLALSSDVASVTGKYFIRSKPAKLSKMCEDESLARQVWTVSEGLVGIVK